MIHDHEHHDFICPDCGALVTCLSCLEVHAGQLPRGPAFTAERFAIQAPPQPPVFETIGVANEFEIIEPSTHDGNQRPLPTAIPNTQQSLFV